jgi:hypothetical protein
MTKEAESKATTTAESKPKATAAEDAATDYQKEHEYTGPQMTAEEYNAIGRGKGYKPRTGDEETLPGSTVLVPEGVEVPDQATTRTTSKEG